MVERDAVATVAIGRRSSLPDIERERGWPLACWLISQSISALSLDCLSSTILAASTQLGLIAFALGSSELAGVTLLLGASRATLSHAPFTFTINL